ncbi:MAG: hypothetical protein ABFC77_12700 [Thermoguttaceae bacterium]
MRYRFAIVLLLAALGGCGAELSQQDLGRVVFEVPTVAGSEKPYMPPPSSGVKFTTEEDQDARK